MSSRVRSSSAPIWNTSPKDHVTQNRHQFGIRPSPRVGRRTEQLLIPLAAQRDTVHNTSRPRHSGVMHVYHDAWPPAPNAGSEAPARTHWAAPDPLRTVLAPGPGTNQVPRATPDHVAQSTSEPVPTRTERAAGVSDIRVRISRFRPSSIAGRRRSAVCWPGAGRRVANAVRIPAREVGAFIARGGPSLSRAA
jgi:hypothetical protein